jgi:Aerobic-type carbon monoxide dehydrogenase, small subunit CoxS/CutS homologs
MRVKVQLTLTVNGEARDVVVAAHKTLLEVLREDLGLREPSTAASWASAAPARSWSMASPCSRAWRCPWRRRGA